jgi:hypothetical protein
MAKRSVVQPAKKSAQDAALIDAINDKDLAIHELETLIGTLQLLCADALDGDAGDVSARTVSDVSCCGYALTMRLKTATATIESPATTTASNAHRGR